MSMTNEEKKSIIEYYNEKYDGNFTDWRELIVHLYLNKFDRCTGAVAKFLGVTHGTVFYHVQKSGIRTNSKGGWHRVGQVSTRSLVQNLPNEKTKKMTMIEIALHLKRHPDSVRNYMWEFKKPYKHEKKRPRGKEGTSTMHRIKAMSSAETKKRTVMELAEELNANPYTVYGYMRKFGKPYKHWWVNDDEDN